MKSLNFLDSLSLFTQSFFYGYVVAVPLLFLLGRLFYKKKETFTHYVHLSNLLLALASLSGVFLFVGETIRSLTWMMKRDGAAPDATAFLSDVPAVYFILHLLVLLLGNLFWLKKIRRNGWATAAIFFLVLDVFCHCGPVSFVVAPGVFFRSSYWPEDIPFVIVSFRCLSFLLLFAVAAVVEYFSIPVSPPSRSTAEQERSGGETVR